MAPSLQAIAATPAPNETKVERKLREQSQLIRDLRDTITQLRIKLDEFEFAGYSRFVRKNPVARSQAAKLFAEWGDRYEEETQAMLRLPEHE